MTRLPHGPRSPRARLGWAVGAQLALAGGLMLPLVPDHFGATTVTLRTEPVDPRDLLRGQYLVLGYSVSRVRAGAGVEEGRPAYVPLTRGSDGVWTGSEALAQRPASGVFLKGQVGWVSGGRASLNYGLERFYLSESAALQQERLGTAGLLASVKVARSGRARLVGLSRNGAAIR